jgi:putative hydrolase of the HAD superfamily
MIKAITFDLWNTLFENISYSELRLNLLNTHLKNKNPNISLSDLLESYNNFFSFVHPRLKKLDFTHVYTKERITKLLDELNIGLSSIELDGLINEIESTMLENPPLLKKGVKDTLVTLNQDYKLAIISDTGITPGRIIRIVLDQYEILNFFETTIFSDEIGYYKPHSIAFKTALDYLDCAPEHSIHIGDLLETDIRGAKEYNMYTIWFKNQSQNAASNIQPDFEIDEISEVINIVKNIL